MNRKIGFNAYRVLVKNLNDIMCGEYNDVICAEDLEKSKHIGFLLNNFTIDVDSNKAIFYYEDIVVDIGGVMNHTHDLEFENYMINLFIRQDDFLKAYKMFEREYIEREF